MAIKALVVVAIALSAGACSAQAAKVPARPAATSAVSPADLDGTDWHFVKVAGEAVPAGVTATLRLKAGHASGKAGCNAYGAVYHVAADGTAGFTRNLATQMVCLQPPGGMQVQRGIYAAFQHTARVAITHGQLVLLDTSGRPLATLARSASPNRS